MVFWILLRGKLWRSTQNFFKEFRLLGSAISTTNASYTVDGDIQHGPIHHGVHAAMIRCFPTVRECLLRKAINDLPTSPHRQNRIGKQPNNTSNTCFHALTNDASILDHRMERKEKQENEARHLVYVQATASAKRMVLLYGDSLRVKALIPAEEELRSLYPT